MPQVSQHAIQNNVEIHLEEPLKVNTDILTDSQQVNLLDDVKNIERNKGEDTIITIESKQLDASAFQRPPDALGETSTPALQQPVERGGVTTATRGGRSVDIVKSIIYGGLIELIASLSVVASAAGADAAILNVLALGLANIFGGLFVISHDDVLRLQLHLAQCGTHSQELDNMQYTLREFYSTCPRYGDISYGPFMKLGREIQELSVCCLYYFSFMDPSLLQSVAGCCLCEYFNNMMRCLLLSASDWR